tara:strand:+ start:7550 stop:7987 length:438 start_codon:yes stop_codon:yes gene_type:complete
MIAELRQFKSDSLKMAIFSRIKNRFALGGGGDEFDDVYEDEFVEIDTSMAGSKSSKIVVKSFVVRSFEDIKDALNDLRNGYTIALINIKPLKDRDVVELKRTINKLKKTCDAIEGDIAGISEDWVVVTPGFAQVFRNKQTAEVRE